MGVAARVAGWQRRLGGKPGPFGVPHSGGEQPSGTAVQVELFLDGLWTDITSYVMVRDGSQRITIVRGQPNEGSRTDPSRCSMQINNRDGRFSPRNPMSPYYGKLGRNQPIRVSVPLGNAKDYRFWGEVAAWPQGWDTTGTDVWVDLQAAGLLRRLGQGQTPLRSVMYRALTSPTLVGPPVAYWPCEDAQGSASLASAVGGPPMSIVGSPALASSDDFVASADLPVLTSGTAFIGDVPPYSVTGNTQVRWLLGVPSGGFPADSVLFRINATGTAVQWEVFYTVGGGMGIRATDLSGAIIANTGAFGFALDGTLNRLSVELEQSGADIVFRLVRIQPGTGGSFIGGTLVGYTAGAVSSVTVAPFGGLTNAVAGHVSVQNVVTSIFDLGPQLNAHIGETASARLNRLGQEAGIPVSAAGGGTPALMGAQRPATLLALMQECVDADMGTFYEQRAALGLGYRGRSFNYNQPPNIALSYAGFNLSQVPVPVDDDSFTRNDITATRTSGSSARATLETGALSVAEPPAGVGRYDDAVTINVQSDTQLPDQAAWRLHVGTVDEARYPQISVNLAHPTFQNDAVLREQLLSIDMGWRMTLVDLPPWLPPDDVSLLAIGQQETIDQFQHRVSFNCAPESPYQVAVTDSTTLGRADTEGSVLAAPVDTTATTLSVSTTSGPAWVTDVGEFPFDIRMGGEVVTVTAVAGASSPQSFTVVRSVNGVVKAHAAGADIRLNQPAIVAL